MFNLLAFFVLYQLCIYVFLVTLNRLTSKKNCCYNTYSSQIRFEKYCINIDASVQLYDVFSNYTLLKIERHY